MSYRLVVVKRQGEQSVHHFDDYDTMDYNAVLLQFSTNPELVKVVAQEEKLVGWETLFTIDYDRI